MDSNARTSADHFTELATLAGGLAHEIRNPLSVFSLNLELLIEDFEQAETPRDRRALKRLKLLETECKHLEQILNDFLQFARVSRLQLESGNLNLLVGEFIEYYRPQAKEHRVELSPHLDNDLPAVLLDPNLFRQVLMNLVQNAQQAMPEGGVIEIQTRRSADRVILDVIDTGRGMDAKTQAKMFDVFFSTRQSGSGLGLPTVRRIVEAHAGTITCASEPGRGTQFTISLPAIKSE